MPDLFAETLKRLSRLPGVRGAMLVDAEAGVPVASELTEDVVEPAVAALTASLFRRTARATEAARFGRLDAVQLQASGGHVLAVGAGPAILVVVAERDAQLGLIRLEAHRAAGELA